MDLWKVEIVYEITLIISKIIKVHVCLENEFSKGASITVYIERFVFTFKVKVTSIGFPELLVDLGLVFLSLLDSNIESSVSILELSNAGFSAESCTSGIKPVLEGKQVILLSDKV